MGQYGNFKSILTWQKIYSDIKLFIFRKGQEYLMFCDILLIIIVMMMMMMTMMIMMMIMMMMMMMMMMMIMMMN